MRHEVPAYEGESHTGFLRGQSGPSNQHGDSGGASRFFQTFEPEYDVPFFYAGKASRSDKNGGIDDLADRGTLPILELRSDLTEEERAFVLTELKAAGVSF